MFYCFIILLVVGLLVLFVWSMFNMRFLVCFGLFCAGLISSEPVVSDANSLRLISVFLRHGARTPELKDAYPNDPYKLEAFQPMGWGQLTNHGKQMAFTLGKTLRNRYNKFLGDLYIPEVVFTQSTDFDRTKMSALLALAGLFPPVKNQKWNENLDWQPIPFEYEKDRRDFVLKRPNNYCPTYMKELEEVLQSDDVLAYIKANRETFQYIANHTGRPINKLSDVVQVYQTLTAEKTLNLTLPEWTKKVYPEQITKIAAKQCEMENYNEVLKKLNGGRMLRKVIDNMVAKTEGTLHPHERKIFIYSGHENNVINVLAAMGLYETHFPNYSSAVLIELHYLRSRQDYAVKVSYIPDVYKDPVNLNLAKCDVLCPLNTFISLTEKHVPKNYTEECDSSFNLD